MIGRIEKNLGTHQEICNDRDKANVMLQLHNFDLWHRVQYLAEGREGSKDTESSEEARGWRDLLDDDPRWAQGFAVRGFVEKCQTKDIEKRGGDRGE